MPFNMDNYIDIEKLYEETEDDKQKRKDNIEIEEEDFETQEKDTMGE